MPSPVTVFAAVLSITLAVIPAVASAGVSSVVIDAGTGRTLYADDAGEMRYPASLTKMMTLYLLFEQISRGEKQLSTRMRVSQRAASMPPTKLGLRPGSTITVRDAILALTTKSANDMAVVVAEAVAGSESRFAQRMTAKARALGMRSTTFRNASGLHHPGQKTTARDMAMLGRALLRDHPRYYANFGVRTFAYGNARYGNHNRLLGTYRGVDGIKTGFTNASGYNLVASAKRNNVRIIGVVMGSPSSASRNALMARLLDRGFSKAPADRVTAARVRRTQSSRSEVRFAPPPPRPRIYARGRIAPKSSREEVRLGPPSARPWRDRASPSG